MNRKSAEIVPTLLHSGFGSASAASDSTVVRIVVPIDLSAHHTQIHAPLAGRKVIRAGYYVRVHNLLIRPHSPSVPDPSSDRTVLPLVAAKDGSRSTCHALRLSIIKVFVSESIPHTVSSGSIQRGNLKANVSARGVWMYIKFSVRIARQDSLFLPCDSIIRSIAMYAASAFCVPIRENIRHAQAHHARNLQVAASKVGARSLRLTNESTTRPDPLFLHAMAMGCCRSKSYRLTLARSSMP